MSEWLKIAKKMAEQYSPVVEYYLMGMAPGEIANKVGYPKFAVVREIDAYTRVNPDLIGRHLRARKGRDPVSKWPNARLVIVGKEWSESDREWKEMNHETV